MRQQTSILLFILTLVFTGCFQTEEDKFPEIKFSWKSQPIKPRVGALTFELEFKKEDGTEYPLVEVDVEGNLSQPGMAPVITKAEPKGNGKYEAKVNATKAGSWFFVLSLKQMSGNFAQKKFTVDISE